MHVDRHVHTRPAGIGDLRTHLDQLTDLDRAHELNPAHVRRHAVGAAPPGRAGVAGLVDPLHDRAAVNLSAEVDVGRLGQEAQRGCVLLAHAYSSLRTAIARFIAIVHLLEYVKLPNYPHQAFCSAQKIFEQFTADATTE